MCAWNECWEVYRIDTTFLRLLVKNVVNPSNMARDDRPILINFYNITCLLLQGNNDLLCLASDFSYKTGWIFLNLLCKILSQYIITSINMERLNSTNIFDWYINLTGWPKCHRQYTLCPLSSIVMWPMLQWPPVMTCGHLMRMVSCIAGLSSTSTVTSTPGSRVRVVSTKDGSSFNSVTCFRLLCTQTTVGVSRSNPGVTLILDTRLLWLTFVTVG